MGTRREKPREPIEREHALRHAQMAARRAWAGGVSDMQDWGTAELDPEPLVLHDLNGEPLFYEFTARAGRREVGRVKAAASRLVGSPVVTLERGPRRWDPSRAMKLAAAAAKKAFPNQDTTPVDFVCYSYPKVGVRAQVGGDKGGSAIFDAADGSPVQQFGDDAAEGQSAWSFLDSLRGCELECRLKSFKEGDAELEAADQATPDLFRPAFTAREAQEFRAKLYIASEYIFLPFYSQRVLTFGPRCTPHECFELYAQQTNVYCAVATGQMILDFYRYHFGQTAIATAMGTDAGGTSQAGQETRAPPARTRTSPARSDDAPSKPPSAAKSSESALQRRFKPPAHRSHH